MTEGTTNAPCRHFALIHDVEPHTDGCEECLAAGDSWVHLRLCLTCGHVGCCNESRNMHATRHFESTGHPIIQSFEPGEDWMWCFVDGMTIKHGRNTVAKDLSKDVLRRLPLFAGLSEDDLERLYHMAEPVFIPEGRRFIQEGDPGDTLYIVLDGEVEVTKRQGGQDVVLAVRGAGEFFGEMSLLDGAPRNASLRTLRDSHLLAISQTAFGTLLSCSPSAPLSMLHTVTTRLRSTQSTLMQHEKMAALGTMAAGLAHELNNPAAAIRRNAASLHDALPRLERLTADLGELALSSEGTAAVEALRTEAAKLASTPLRSDPLERSDREDELLEWLEDAGIDEAWEIAPVLASFGWQREQLATLIEPFSEDELAIVMPWLAAHMSARELLEGVRTSAETISQVVTAVKSYSYLDQAPVQNVDVHAGLENTLVILRHKSRAGVRIVREYDEMLPPIEAFGSELNQVWTNLIDNAIDAMHGEGEIVIRTSATEENKIVVEIVDNGPGIPAEIQARIFEPFFTTKGPGAGTGLGLHIAYNIVERHHGRIEVQSEPGRTAFRITLPIHFA
jgi:signal transduction histidine kinase